MHAAGVFSLIGRSGAKQVMAAGLAPPGAPWPTRPLTRPSGTLCIALHSTARSCPKIPGTGRSGPPRPTPADVPARAGQGVEGGEHALAAPRCHQLASYSRPGAASLPLLRPPSCTHRWLVLVDVAEATVATVDGPPAGQVAKGGSSSW